ncbi:DoxX family protein [Nocardia arthritidis]|uniref:DoxX family protein n=1 Tax=Nocardia arthritidis TaxID=228602 RepID=A0A6G9YMA5_9NOCA|nr:DoxX family protein [Nocardia arthritidis]QIS14344.1 DoxX family protein [Nocardia arthritidis]
MSTVTEDIDATEASPEAVSRPTWNPLTRIAFRFTFAYFGLFCVLFAQILFAFAGIATQWLPMDLTIWQMKTLEPVTEWVGRTVFGADVVLRFNGSGDQAAIWVFVFDILVAAVIVTAVWTLLDRRRTEYARLHGWFLTFLRLCLGGQLLLYGFAKLIPIQMPYPPLTTLLSPYGEQHLTGVLWNQVGSVPVYQSLLGAAEVTAGLLLFLPRTATAGALLGMVSMAQVWILNMTFDVPVKILSFHMLLLSLVLLAPQARRLANILVLERPSEPATQPRLFSGRRANRIAAVVQVALGIWIAAGFAQAEWKNLYEGGLRTPKPALYGIWNVTDFSIDGHDVPPLVTDESRWRRLVFDIENFAAFQRMDDSFVPLRAAVDTEAHTVALSNLPRTSNVQPHKLADLTFDRPAPDRLTLHGDLNGHPVTIALRQFDLNSLPLKGPGFHWIHNAEE